VPEATIEGLFGYFNNYEARASVNIPIVDEKLAMRLSGYYVTRDGFDKRINVGGRTVDDDWVDVPRNRVNWPSNPNLYRRDNSNDYYFDEPYVFEDGRVNDDNRWGIKGRVLLDVMENFSLLVTGDYSYQDNNCCVADIITYEGAPSLDPALTFQELARPVASYPPPVWPPAPPNTPPPPPSVLRFQHLRVNGGTGIPLPDADPFDRVVTSNTDSRNIVEIGGATIDAEYEFEDIPWLGGNLLSLIAAWRTYSSDGQFDGDFSYYNAVPSWTETKLNQYSVELRLASPGGELVDYQTGFYYYHQSQDTVDKLGFQSDFVTKFAVAPAGTENINDNTHKTTSYAGFGEVTINPIEQLSVTGGVRVTHEQKTRTGTQISTACLPPPGWPEVPFIGICLDAPPVLGPPIYIGPGENERAVTNVSYKGVVQYFPWEDIMLYGSYATGFKSGGFNQLRVTEGIETEFDDELSKNVEAGFKTSFFERMLTFNVTGFHTWYEDFQSQIFDGSSISVVNAADLTSYGIEAELTVVPLPNLVIGSAFGWNVAEYGDFPNGVQTNQTKWELSGGDPLACAADPLLVPLEACVQDLSGKTLDNAPRYTVNVFAQYEYLLPWVPIEVFVRGEYAYTSSRFLDVDLDPNLFQPDTHIGNVRAGFRAEDKMWELTGWVRNVTDEGYNVAGFDVPTLNGFAGVNAPPRQYGLTIRLNFGPDRFDWF
jgi:iron complex outermembrane receptor protein